MKEFLQKKRKDNLDQKILWSETQVIDRLLTRDPEMSAVYKELAQKLEITQREFLFDALLGAACYWTPEDSRQLRDVIKELEALNVGIARLAAEMAEKMERRFQLSEEHGLSSHDDYHVMNWFHRAGRANGNYRSFLQGELDILKHRLDLKYWPRTPEVIRAAGKFAEEAQVLPTDSWTDALLSSTKSSRADYLRVILQGISERKEECHPPHMRLPESFSLSDASLATFINCSLDLESDNLATTEYVKRARQEMRKSERKSPRTPEN